MEALPLDPGAYSGTYKLVGGRPSLDFVNTLSWPSSERGHDWLDPPSNISLWAQASGVWEPEESAVVDACAREDPRVVATDLRSLREARETMRAVLSPLAVGDQPQRDSVDQLNRLLEQAGGRRRLDPSSLAWNWLPARRLGDLAWPVLYDAANLLAGTDGDPKRIGRCPSCDWLFYDTTRGRNRRWCDMADCGSRDKALRYYHRKAGN